MELKKDIKERIEKELKNLNNERNLTENAFRLFQIFVSNIEIDDLLIEYDKNNDIWQIYKHIEYNLTLIYPNHEIKKEHEHIVNTERLNEIALLKVFSEILNDSYFEFTELDDNMHTHFAYFPITNLLLELHKSYDDKN